MCTSRADSSQARAERARVLRVQGALELSGLESRWLLDSSPLESLGGWRVLAEPWQASIVYPAIHHNLLTSASPSLLPPLPPPTKSLSPQCHRPSELGNLRSLSLIVILISYPPHNWICNCHPGLPLPVKSLINSSVDLQTQKPAIFHLRQLHKSFLP